MPIFTTTGATRGFGIFGGPKATVTGGTLVATDSTYYYRVFKSTGNLVITGANLPCEYLVVGAGGAGVAGGGGGGAGGVRSGTATLTPASYAATIGAGAFYSVGGYSEFNSLRSLGGGYGSSNGGSGAGATAFSSPIAAGAGTVGQGNPGGSATGGTYSGGGGGGGGAGASGSSTSNTQGANGGSGTTSYSSWLSVIGPIMTQTWRDRTNSTTIAGGGGGGSYIDQTYGGSPGAGGGGFGGSPTWNYNSTGFDVLMSGVENTGGGGGGGGFSHEYSQDTVYQSAPGGSGLIIVRYRKEYAV